MILGSGNVPENVINPSFIPILSNPGDENTAALCVPTSPPEDAEAVWRMRLLDRKRLCWQSRTEVLLPQNLEQDAEFNPWEQDLEL